MSITHHIQPNFSGGEVSPGLYSRVDISKYQAGLKTARNVNILPHGGIRNRPGTYKVASAGDSTNAVRVIPFVYSTEQAYVLEFGNYYVRFYTGGSPINASSTVTAWTTGTSYNPGDYVTDASTPTIAAKSIVASHNVSSAR